MTHYEVLGVAPDAPTAEIRRAYLALARLHHPDVHSAGAIEARAAAAERMQAITQAWAVLGDEERRRAYDVTVGLRGAAPGDAAGEVFVPFDLGDDPDPLDEADAPYRPGPPSSGRRLATLAPVGTFAASVVVFAVGLVLGAVPVLVLAVLLFAVSCVLFVAVPLVTLAQASRDDG